MKAPKCIAKISGLRELDLSSLCGIYFSCLRGEVVYVGQSINIAARIKAHGTVKQFDSIFFCPIPAAELDVTERRFIATLQPKLNRAHKAPEQLTVKSHVRLTPHLFRQVKELARADERTVQDELRYLIALGIDAYYGRTMTQAERKRA